MIFTGDDYTRFYSSNQNIEFLRNVWRDNQLLLVGFGFSDPFLVRVLESALRTETTDNRHFALIGVPAGKCISPLLRRNFARKYRLTPIFYEVRSDANGDEDHTDLFTLLSLLTEKIDATLPAEGHSASLVLAAAHPTSHVAATVRSRDFEKDLMVSPTGKVLYVEPRLLRPLPVSEDSDKISYEPADIDFVLQSTSSFCIIARPEYGATTLCRRIVDDLVAAEIDATYRDANSLPNYKAKLRQEFDISANAPLSRAQVLVLDGFADNRHERLLKELVGLQHFSRIVLVLQSNSSIAMTAPTDGAYGLVFEPLLLTHLDRADIRRLASDLFDTADNEFVSAIVEKVYSDLLSLCIPLTPANVIMYLTILFKEGDFSPLNRVQIIDRYIQELLRRPSDVYQDTFNAKNKADVISAFVHSRFVSGHGTFTETDWLSFCRQHMQDTLVRFDERALLHDLLASRIFVYFNGLHVLKYKAFYAYFVGRHVANRPTLLDALMEHDRYLSIEGLVEVVTALSADNSTLILDIVEKLDSAIVEFNAQYALGKADPFAEVRWPSHEKEEERLWQPVTKAIAAGPLAADELDRLKRSIEAERRTEDQSVVVRDFDRREKMIGSYYQVLIAALTNSDTLAGSEKMRAMHAVLDANHLFYNIAVLLSSVIARHRAVFWSGVVFLNDLAFSSKDDAERRAAIIAAMTPGVISKSVASSIGSKKLGEVYRSLISAGGWVGFKKLLLFTLLLRSKPHGWLNDAQSMLAAVERNSIYMKFMLDTALAQFREEINTVNERDGLKTIISVIRAKRDLNKNQIGARVVGKVRKELEDREYFSGRKG
jgi:SIR2-like protein